MSALTSRIIPMAPSIFRQSVTTALPERSSANKSKQSILHHAPVAKLITFHTKTDVTFDLLSEAEIDAYIETGEPMDKAGAYGIQGVFGRHIKAINGDFYNVMGLPMNDLYKRLKEEKILFI